MRSPIVWFGGKGMMSKKLLPLLPRCHTYVEAFGGGASMLFAKHPSPVEVYNDLDGGLVGFFRVLRNPEQFKEFHRLVSLTPYARREFLDCRDAWKTETDPVTRAYMWFVVARISFSGEFGASMSTSVTSSHRGMASTVSKWLSIIDLLPQIADRLLRVQIEQADFRIILDRYDTPETLFYLDPPYVLSTRKGGKYEFELSDKDHADLVSLLLNLKGRAMLSGYAHDLYAPLEAAGWERKDFKTTCYAAGRTRASGLQGGGAVLEKQARVETVYMNYKMQGRLF